MMLSKGNHPSSFLYLFKFNFVASAELNSYQILMNMHFFRFFCRFLGSDEKCGGDVKRN